MSLSKTVILLSVCYLIAGNSTETEQPVETETTERSLRIFPDDFKFGVATSSYQIEGAWNHDGKSWSMWDYVARTARKQIADGTNGDIAANSYYFYERDVRMLKELGVQIYRFSISWTRILPDGRPDYVNPEGIAYYNKLIDLLLRNNIIPFVTMYHWDLPQTLSEKGGWLNADIVDWFGDYAKVLYENFGDRVKYWMTINEPFIHCSSGYGTGMHAPLIKSPGIGYYQCGRNVLLAHARAYHLYNAFFRTTQNGQISIVTNMEWALASTESDDDVEAVEDYISFNVRYFTDPIYSETGNYPQRVIDKVAAASANQGYNASRLPPFTPEEIEYIRGTADYFALNHYSTDIVYRNSSLNGTFEVPSYEDDCFVGTYKDPTWPTSASPWISEYAPGLYKLLVFIKENYNNPPIYITENGVSTKRTLSDYSRIQYLRNYLNAVLDALDEGVEVRGYCVWSLMDNFEWSNGYNMRFGLYELDIKDPERPRVPRKSAAVYRDIISRRVIDLDYLPDTRTLSGNAPTISVSVVLTLVVAVFNVYL